MELSLQDKKILGHLCIDARTPLKKIAKTIGLSLEGTAYRIARLEKKGIISKYTLYPDEFKFNLQIYHIYFKFHTLPKETETLFKNIFQESGYCSLIWKTRGNWDYIVQFYAKDNFHLDSLLEHILSHDTLRIKQYKTYFATHQLCFSQLVGDAFLDFEDPYRIIDPLKKRVDDIKLTQTDITLLKHLVNHGRDSYAQMGRELDVAPETLRASYNKLKKQKIIITTFASINKFAMGWSYNAVDVKLSTNSPNKIRPLLEFIRTNRYIHYAAKVTGALEIHMAFVTKNNNEFGEQLEEIRSRFSDILEDVDIHPIFSEEGEAMFPSGYVN